ncbi:MAG: 23S rRNA (guanosine(2251)-2'-O)-methyltransferase RlmB [Candidatus Omnitrophica bacterium]|nr:23S rRNA (guanosine(2251)-2'-O)-methyltransferase RlmB [Candidatus Omnitrophota bacterium]
MKLYGKNPVIERIRSNPQSIRRILVEQGHADHGFIAQKAKKWGIPVSAVPASQLLKIARNVNTQGIVADVDDFLYTPYVELLEMASSKHWSILFLDGVTDPQNLGSILRSLGCLGGFAVVLPTKDSVSVTEAVLRIASGGENFVRISQVSNLAQAIVKAKDAGFWIAGSVVQEGEDLSHAKLQFPLGLVVGSEQKGIRDVILQHVDLKLTIPMAKNKMSLNVAQAATIFAYEISRQKK